MSKLGCTFHLTARVILGLAHSIVMCEGWNPCSGDSLRLDAELIHWATEDIVSIIKYGKCVNYYLHRLM